MIIWIASYPKSGNTLVRAILSSLIYSENGNFNFNLLNKIDQYPQKKHFDGLTSKYGDLIELSKNWIFSQNRLNLNKKIKYLKTHHLNCTINKKNYSPHEFMLSSTCIRNSYSYLPNQSLVPWNLPCSLQKIKILAIYRYNW